MRRVVGSTRLGPRRARRDAKTPTETLSVAAGGQRRLDQGIAGLCGGRRAATSAIMSSATMLLTPSEHRIKASPACSGRPLVPIIGLMSAVVPSACRMTLCIGLRVGLFLGEAPS